MDAVRTCIGCRVRASQEQLIRVVEVSGRLQLDWNRTLPGRGAWLHPQVDCVAHALDRKQFRRALRAGELDDSALRSYLTALPAKVVDRTMDQS
ncbi:YlxR family protein [Gulosibacter sediminis]|uniref:YlxR family protein n=1 Tax=Gulosibacter sediminis TaxID=1729695 RepID=UPI0024ADE665|nr:YlxR family protein [Gulosibacter sediminis]